MIRFIVLVRLLIIVIFESMVIIVLINCGGDLIRFRVYWVLLGSIFFEVDWGVCGVG